MKRTQRSSSPDAAYVSTRRADMMRLMGDAYSPQDSSSYLPSWLEVSGISTDLPSKVLGAGEGLMLKFLSSRSEELGSCWRSALGGKKVRTR